MSLFGASACRVDFGNQKQQKNKAYPLSEIDFVSGLRLSHFSETASFDMIHEGSYYARLVYVFAVNNNVELIGAHGVLITPKGRSGVDALVIDLVAVYNGIVYDQLIGLAVIVADLDRSLQISETAVVVEGTTVYGKLSISSTVKKNCFTVIIEGAVIKGCRSVCIRRRVFHS